MDVSVAEAHNRLSRWLNKIKDGPITITRRGRPVGIIISPEEYRRLSQVHAYLQMLRLSQTLRDSGVTAQELAQASRTELEGRQ